MLKKNDRQRRRRNWNVACWAKESKNFKTNTKQTEEHQKTIVTMNIEKNDFLIIMRTNAAFDKSIQRTKDKEEEK